MKLYSVCVSNPGAFHEDQWVEFYYADDPDHAKRKAQDANVSAEILSATEVVVNEPEAILSDDLKSAIHEVADLTLNPEGYADDHDESMLRSNLRDDLESRIVQTVTDFMREIR